MITLAHIVAGLPTPTPGKMEMGPISQALSPDEMPEITPDVLGKYRLLGALKKKFGPMYRNNPNAARAVRHFENQFALHQTLQSMMGRAPKVVA